MKELNQKVLERLHTLINIENKIENEAVVIQKWNFKIFAAANVITTKAGYCSMVINFTVTSPLLDSDFSEITTSVGRDEFDVMEKGILNFISCAFDSLRRLHENKFTEKFNTSFFGVEKKWNGLFTSLNLVFTESNAHSDLSDTYFWDKLKEKILKRLGSRRTYFLKILLMKNKDSDIVAEFRINDCVDSELSSELKNMIENLWNKNFENADDVFFAAKQFIIIHQENTNYIQYPYTNEQLTDYIRESINILTSNISKFDKVVKIYEMTNDTSLAFDLYNFIPEIYAMNFFSNLKYSDIITLKKENNIEMKIYKSQSANFENINRIIGNLKSDDVFKSEDIFRKLILSTAIFSLTEQAEKNNIDMNKMTVELSFSIPKNYHVR